MKQKEFFCSICNASCGLIARIDKGKIQSIIPDKHHPLSKGYCCPKGLSMGDVTNDPDRVTQPKKFINGKWVTISWKQALSEIARELTSLMDKHGPDSIGSYMGTNGGHSYSHSMYWKGFMDAIGSKNSYNAGSVDNNNKFVAQFFLYGNSSVMPIPDLINTDYVVLIGTNPAATHLSLASCQNVMQKIKTIASRGKVIVIDPRINETTKQVQSKHPNNVEHHFIWPTTDIFFLLALMNVIISEDLHDKRYIDDVSIGFTKLKEHVKHFTPELASKITKISSNIIKRIAREFAKTPKAVMYGRIGTSLTRFPTLNAWAIDVLNLITGHLDKEGCAIFGYGPFNIPKVGKLVNMGSYDQYRSRIGNYPEVMGGFPLSNLAKEISTKGKGISGKGQIKALIETGGNVVLSAPNSNELISALKNLKLMVHIDFYMNETCIIAAEEAKIPLNFFLPASTTLEQDNIHLMYLNYMVKPHVEYHEALVKPRGSAKQEWEIFLALTRKMKLKAFGNNLINGIKKILNILKRQLTPTAIVRILAIVGNIIEKRIPKLSEQAFTFGDIEKKKLFIWKHHRFGVIENYLLTPDKKVHLMEKPIEDNLLSLRNVEKEYIAYSKLDEKALLLIGRRHKKTMNSWMHNVPRLWKNSKYPKLLINKKDASKFKVKDDDEVILYNNLGEIKVPIQLSDDMMEGVICYPHGWGHVKNKLTFAQKNPGQNFNVLTNSDELDTLSGMPSLNGVKVLMKKKK